MSGEILKRMFEVMEKKNIKAKDLCSILHIKENTLSSWKARGKDPEAKDIFAICEFLGITCEFLLTGFEPKLQEQSFSKEDYELLSLINSLPHDAKLEFRGEIKGYIKGLRDSVLSEEPSMKQAK